VAYNKKLLPTVITSILLSSFSPRLIAAWDCRPSADGQGWSCAKNGGEYETPIQPARAKVVPPALAGAHINPTDNVNDEGLVYEAVPKRMQWVNPELLASEQAWAHCTTHQYDVLAEKEDLKTPSRAKADTHIVADHVEYATDDGIVNFFGNVAIHRADQRIQGDHIAFDQDDNLATVLGDVAYKETGLLFTNGSEAFFNLNKNTGSMENPQFILESVPARGKAVHVEVESVFVTHFNDIEYTTCRPGNQDWQLNAEQLTLNQDTGIGEARHATVRFLGAPIFYSPYYSFPLDDRRKSGFLAPVFGVSDEDGYDLTVPYYWDIAANYDATIIPRIITKRGIQLGGEFRYLLDRNNGTMFAEFLPGDDLRGDDRGLFSWKHNSVFSQDLTGKLNLNYVSDDEYFEDFGKSLALSSPSNVERLAELTYHRGFGKAVFKLQQFQSVDKTIASASEPFQRLPQVTYEYERAGKLGLTHHLDSEFVYFGHPSNERETAARIDLKPGISLPIETLGWFVTPRLDYRYTYYDIDNQANLADDHFERSLPIFSVDSGLFLEKNTSFFGEKYLHTIEPRLFYLNVPFKNQDDFPNFDTSEFDFSTAQLFRDNRFNNADRQGEANQLSYSLASRFLNADSGREIFDISLSQIIFFEDRDVVLGAKNQDDEESTSPFITEVGWNITSQLKTRYTLQFDPHQEVTERNEFRLRYNADKGHIFNVDYRQRRNVLEETDISFRWKLLPQWHIIGRNHYSLEDHHVIENFAGLEYESCCWIGRVLAQHFVDDIDDSDDDGDHEGETSIYFQIELKGFASIGDKITDRIEEGVINYDSYTD